MEAAAFADETGVDGLAVAVGSSHAMTTRDAELDVPLIHRLAAEVAVPLVLHGSSGVSDDQLRLATDAGIRKINVGTALNAAYTGAIREVLAANPNATDPRKHLSRWTPSHRRHRGRAVSRRGTAEERNPMSPNASAALETNPLANTIARHKAGEPVGIYSVCSAHPTVVEAAIAQAAADGAYVLIEATSNQVDQFGGYTGLRPAEFRDLVLGIADDQGFPRDRVVLGGDHLGPNRWQRETSSAAMEKAETSHRRLCRGWVRQDPPGLQHVLRRRPRRPLRRGRRQPVGTTACGSPKILRTASDSEGPLYVIGTEVPVPGGAHETLDQLTPTPADRARRTITAHQAAFAELGLDYAWPRVVALVVQPGVEFDHLNVFDYVRGATTELRHVLDSEGDLVFEAHSTDYQRPEQLRELVEDHWAILKVGPACTFAMREALFALAMIETELVARTSRSNLIEVVERRMLAEPGYWEDYYQAGGERRDGGIDSPRAQRTAGATATAIAFAITGPTTKSTPPGARSSRTWTARVSHCP